MKNNIPIPNENPAQSASNDDLTTNREEFTNEKEINPPQDKLLPVQNITDRKEELPDNREKSASSYTPKKKNKTSFIIDASGKKPGRDVNQ